MPASAQIEVGSVLETKRGRCTVVDVIDKVDCVVVRWGWTGEEVVAVVVFQEIVEGRCVLGERRGGRVEEEVVKRKEKFLDVTWRLPGHFRADMLILNPGVAALAKEVVEACGPGQFKVAEVSEERRAAAVRVEERSGARPGRVARNALTRAHASHRSLGPTKTLMSGWWRSFVGFADLGSPTRGWRRRTGRWGWSGPRRRSRSLRTGGGRGL